MTQTETHRRWYWVTHNGVDSLWNQAPDGSCHELCTMAQYAQPDEFHLLAAAPDLLEALIAVMALGAWEHQPDCDSVAFGIELCGCGYVDRVGVARDAIAKAQGDGVVHVPDSP